MSLIEKYPQEIKDILAKYPPDQKRSAVMPLLYMAQRDGGYTSLEAMKERGLTIHPLDEDARNAWLATTQKAYPKVRDTLIPGEMLDRVDALIAEFRAQTH